MVAILKPRSASPKPPSRIKRADFKRMLETCNARPKAPLELKARLAAARALIRNPS